MEAGSLRHRVTIERATRTVNSAGETEVVWAEHAVFPAEVKPLRAFQVERARQVQMHTTHVVRMRYTDAVAPDDRIVWDGGTLNITGIVNVGGRGVELEITCEQEGAAAP